MYTIWSNGWVLGTLLCGYFLGAAAPAVGKWRDWMFILFIFDLLGLGKKPAESLLNRL